MALEAVEASSLSAFQTLSYKRPIRPTQGLCEEHYTPSASCTLNFVAREFQKPHYIIGPTNVSMVTRRPSPRRWVAGYDTKPTTV